SLPASGMAMLEASMKPAPTQATCATPPSSARIVGSAVAAIWMSRTAGTTASSKPTKATAARRRAAGSAGGTGGWGGGVSGGVGAVSGIAGQLLRKYLRRAYICVLHAFVQRHDLRCGGTAGGWTAAAQSGKSSRTMTRASSKPPHADDAILAA